MIKKALRWAKKYDHLLTIVGAIIIFLTFLAKEVFRDEATELHNSIEVVQTNHVVEGELLTIETLTGEIKDELTGANKDLDSKQRKVRASVDWMRAQAINLRTLDTKLPRDEDHGCSEENLLNITTTVGKLSEMGTDEALEEIPRDEEKVLECEQNMVHTALVIEWDSAQSAERWKIFEYALFGIGWSLTLLGKLAKRESISGLPG